MDIINRLMDSLQHSTDEDKTHRSNNSAELFARSIINHIPNMIFVKDAKNLHFVELNKAGEELLGIKRSDFIGKSDYDFFPKEQADFFFNKDRQALAKNEVSITENEEISTAKGKRILRTKKIPIRDSRGEPQYLLGISEDITDRMAAVKNKIELDKLNQVCHAKGEIMANICHEIRNPLGAIVGFAELGKDNDNANPEVAKYFSTILKCGKQIQGLIDEVLDFSKAESNKIKVKIQECSLHEALEDIRDIMSFKPTNKDLEISYDYSILKNRRFYTDPVRVKQILLNLFCNSVKFTSKGHISLKVSEEKLRDKSLLHFDIEDTGIGIGKAKQVNLFKPYEQVDLAITRKFGGSGLGLYLSKHMAHLLSAELKLMESEEGKGSRFRLSLPVTEVLKTTDSTDRQAAKGVFEDKARCTALVIDDSEDNRILMNAYLQKMDISSEQAENGEEGLRKMQSKDYDFVFMDIQMPKMDGVTAVESAREMGYKNKVIALTGQTMDKESFLKSGFDNVLTKPLSYDSLCEFIRQHHH